MKTKLYILIVCIAAITACSEKKVQQIPLIEGLITNYPATEVYLFSDTEPNQPLDTIKISPEGTFTIPKKSIQTIGFYYLDFKKYGRINLFLKPRDYVNMEMNANNLLESCRSNNSKFLTALWSLEKVNKQFNTDMQQLTVEFEQMTQVSYNDSLYKKLCSKKEKLTNKYRKQSMDIAKEINNPVIDFLMLNQKAGNVPLFSLKNDLQLFLDNTEQLNNKPELKALFADYDKNIMQAYSSIRSEERYGKGGTFPELRARTNWNEKISLKQVNGQPTHIIFWSGVDLLDEAKITQTKQMMYRYGSRGLKTIMVAYTKDKTEWLNNIKKHNLPFWHLIDTLSVKSLDLQETGVRSLPYNFLVDTTGTIINRDIWDDELEQIIRSNIKK